MPTDTIKLPPREFALRKIGKWALFRLPGGRLVAHRTSFQTLRDGSPFDHPEMFIDWPSACGDIPETTRNEFAIAADEMTKGLT